jgi:hypothetical protein
VTRDGCAHDAAAVRQQDSQPKCYRAGGQRQVQDETGSFTETSPGRSGKLKKWQQHEHADRQMHEQRMEAAEEL